MNDTRAKLESTESYVPLGDTRPHPWESARDEFEETTLPELKRVGKAIGADAERGCPLAKEVVRCYSLLHRSFDPLSLILTQKALAAWKAKGKP